MGVWAEHCILDEGHLGKFQSTLDKIVLKRVAKTRKKKSL